MVVRRAEYSLQTLAVGATPIRVCDCPPGSCLQLELELDPLATLCRFSPYSSSSGRKLESLMGPVESAAFTS